MLKFVMPEILFEDVYSQSMANCCSKITEASCGITYRTYS